MSTRGPTTRSLDERIDDLAVETQVPPNQALSLELQPNDPAGRLSPDLSLAVSVGNGTADDLKKMFPTFGK